jgi:hypothetical protein
MMDGSSRGSVSAFVVCLFLGMVALVGLAYDGGRVSSRYGELSDLAANAARIGAQQVNGIRAGEPRIDPEGARAAAARFLARRNLPSRIVVQGDRITVSVRTIVPMRILSLLGVTERSISVTRSAELVAG